MMKFVNDHVHVLLNRTQTLTTATTSSKSPEASITTSSKTLEASTSSKFLKDTTTSMPPANSYKTLIPTKIPTDSNRFRHDKFDLIKSCNMC